MKNKKNKKGISALVATVLLVLITIAAIGIIWGAILPLIRRGLGTSEACGFETRLDIEKTRGFTCFDENGYVFVEVSRPFTFTQELTKIMIQVSGGGRTDTFEIVNGTTRTGITMYGGSSTLELPKPGESRTYNITVNFNATQVGVAPVVKVGGQNIICQATATEELTRCSI